VAGHDKLIARRLIWWASVPFYGFVAALTIGAGLNPHVPVLGRIACSLLGLGCLGFPVVARRAGILVLDSGLLVRRYSGRNHFIAFGDVSDIELVSNGNGGVYIAVVGLNGHEYITQGLAAASFSSVRGEHDRQSLLDALVAWKGQPGH